ncbi:hypothetical protein AAFF_G00439020 [Aldrovandia affinis]|uniref:Uncharacterized protein n=1 Tax=Aldrovandia affinis TaxID=143900 RepID=A0AAD7S7Q8_9TELE|nr:hypothetical protein AAFF_G00439020 [Aldrovandia affinis]
MSDSVSIFQTQVASVLEVLFNVAVVEITKLFDGSCVVSGGNGVSGESTDPKTPRLVRGELRARAESALGNLGKRIRSVGVQVRDPDPDTNEKKWLSDGKASLPSADRGAFFLEGGEHAEGPRIEVGLKCKLASVQWELSPPEAPPINRLENDVGGIQTGLDSAAEGAIEFGADNGERSPFENQLFEEECGTQPTPVKEEPVTQPIPVKEEQLTQHIAAEDGVKVGSEQEPELHVGSTASHAPTKACKLSFHSPQHCTAESPNTEQQPGRGPALAPPSMGGPAYSPPSLTQPAVGGWLEVRKLRPCSVQLVNVLLISSGRARGQAARSRRGVALPRDLRAHQRLHTGKRLCCFTQCANAQEGVTETI